MYAADAAERIGDRAGAGPELVAMAVTPRPFDEMTEPERDAFLTAFVAEMFEGTGHPQAGEARTLAEAAHTAAYGESDT